MATNEQLDQLISGWLEETAPARIPERVFNATFEQTRKSRQQGSWRAFLGRLNMPRFVPALSAAAVFVLVATLTVNFFVNQQSRIGVLPSATPIATGSAVEPSVPSPTTAAAPTPEPTFGSFDTMWPQRTQEEVHAAQERADAGDPEYTWQLDEGQVGARFVREYLGWDEFIQVVNDPNQPYVRCASGQTNPLYPPSAGREGEQLCAPTIENLSYESVTVRIDQPAAGADISVVIGWETAPFTQVDPRVAEAEATAQLEEFLAARIAGQGAEGYVRVVGDRGMSLFDEVPLLYGTTSGAPYERFEIERVGSPQWPYAEMEFKVRLFATDGATVVEQPIAWRYLFTDSGAGYQLSSNVLGTTENGQPVAVPYGFLGGEVTLSAAHPWRVIREEFFKATLGLNGDYGEKRLAFQPHPLPAAAGCEAGAEPADAAALAQSLLSDADLEATAPVEVSIGGAEGLQMDIAIAPGASLCYGQPKVLTTTWPVSPAFGRQWGSALDQGSLMRLYLLDLPEGSATRILAIAIVAPEAQFDEVLEATAPVLDSIEFHAQ